MTAPETRAVLSALRVEGQEVRFVGGCVRDAILGRPVKDVDIATPDSPEKVVKLLESAGLKAVPTGIEHGTVTAVSDHRPFEITTLREDVETYGRRARVAFTDSWAADAARRDFTMNALFCSPDGTIYDPFGGWADLLAGRVRFVGDPNARIREDYLRLLRFFRFHAHYGHGAPDEAGLRAAAAHAPRLAELSGERVREEIFRLLAAPDPASVLDVMTTHRILLSVLPEAARIGRLRTLVDWESALKAPADPLRRLAALLEGGAEVAEKTAERLRLSRRESERLGALMAPVHPVRVGEPARRLRVALHRRGQEEIRDLLLLDAAERAEKGESPEEADLAGALAEVSKWTPKRLPVGGADARGLGIAPGPRMGRLLTAVERWWEEQDFRPGRDACLEKLKELAGRMD